MIKGSAKQCYIKKGKSTCGGLSALYYEAVWIPAYWWQCSGLRMPQALTWPVFITGRPSGANAVPEPALVVLITSQGALQQKPSGNFEKQDLLFTGPKRYMACLRATQDPVGMGGGEGRRTLDSTIIRIQQWGIWDFTGPAIIG